MKNVGDEEPVTHWDIVFLRFYVIYPSDMFRLTPNRTAVCLWRLQHAGCKPWKACLPNCWSRSCPSLGTQRKWCQKNVLNVCPAKCSQTIVKPLDFFCRFEPKNGPREVEKELLNFIKKLQCHGSISCHSKLALDGCFAEGGWWILTQHLYSKVI